MSSKHFTQRAGEKATGEAVDVHPLSAVDGTSEQWIRKCRRGHTAESKKGPKEKGVKKKECNHSSKDGLEMSL